MALFNPRDNFKQTPHAKVWHEAVVSDWFFAGIQVAQLEMQQELRPAPDMGTAAANDYRMQGAKQLIRIMLNLTEKKEDKPPEKHEGLNYRA